MMDLTRGARVSMDGDSGNSKHSEDKFHCFLVYQGKRQTSAIINCQIMPITTTEY